jgi:hypothetical protein
MDEIDRLIHMKFPFTGEMNRQLSLIIKDRPTRNQKEKYSPSTAGRIARLPRSHPVGLALLPPVQPGVPHGFPEAIP